MKSNIYRMVIALLVSAIALFGCTPKDSEKEYVLVAYVTSWSQAIPDPTIMTHINYAFGHVNDTFDGVRIDNPDRLREIVALKSVNPELKVMLSIGGWESGRFSEMAANEKWRMSFAEDCLRAVKEFGLDGIDMDWEYPTSSAAGISSSPADRDNFNLLMRDLRSALGQDRLLTLASYAYAVYIDFNACIQYLDFVNIMAYDTVRAPLHHSALYSSENTKYTCEGAVQAHVDAGVPVSKLVLGVPLYGRGGSILPLATDYKDFEKIEGFDQLVEMWDEEAQVPYYADKEGNLVMGFDNPESIAAKCRFIKERGLKGGMYWEYAADNMSGDLRNAAASELL